MRITRLAIPLLALLAALMQGCGEESATTPAPPASKPEPALVLEFTYGSEKEKWIEEVTARFHQLGLKSQSGLPIRIQALAMGSGEAMQEVLDGKRQPHLISPASRAVVELYNSRSEEKTGQPILGETQNLVLSPVVIAIWQPMAEALGWGRAPIGWQEIWRVATDPQGWASYGHPEWGDFKFGHTHPEYSNSGLISLLAEVYAATGETRKLRLEDLEAPAVREFVQQIERRVVHYGSSTGFFGRSLFEHGPDYLSAVVLYENMVIESYSRTLPHPIVAIYPKEGSFWSDHPIGVVERPWVTAEHKAAAQQYIDFLLAEEQQRLAMRHGFRPAKVEIPLGEPFTPAFGVDPKQPQRVLPIPSGQVIEAALGLWQERKRPANMTLVVDVSGSMNEGDKIGHARNGASQLLTMLHDADAFSLLVFNNELRWLAQGQSGSPAREGARAKVAELQASGGTALYDAIAAAHQRLRESQDPERIAALVVLSDGADTNSRLTLASLLSQIAFDPKNPIRVFPIAYGQGASLDVLEQIAKASRGRAYQGDTREIESIFRDIGAFF